jgi:hypothetical protein
MRLPHTFMTVLIVLCALSCSLRGPAEQRPSLVCTNVAPAKGDKQWPIYEDDTVKMVAVGYGDASKQSKPGFYVFRKATANWIRIDKVSTRGATFGRSPTFQEVKDAGKTPASIGWDFRNLAEEDQVDFPLTSAGFLFFPHKVERNEKRKEYVLRFNSGWGIAGVETILKLPINELTKRGLEQSPAGDKRKTAPQQ